MQSLGRRYVQYINRKYKRTGTLWEGRFKSSLVSKDEYLLACSRYIELNPIRAKMVKDPKDYPWSSFGFKVEGKSDDLLDHDTIYLSLGKTEKERRLNYKEWFLRSISDEESNLIRSATQKGGIVGNKEFIDKITKALGRNVILRPKGRPRKVMRERV